jgi:hypothetical protein
LPFNALVGKNGSDSGIELARSQLLKSKRYSFETFAIMMILSYNDVGIIDLASALIP